MKVDVNELTRRAAYWLYLGNQARARGDQALAERHYAKSQRWHDKMIDALEAPAVRK